MTNLNGKFIFFFLSHLILFKIELFILVSAQVFAC